MDYKQDQLTCWTCKVYSDQFSHFQWTIEVLWVPIFLYEELCTQVDRFFVVSHLENLESRSLSSQSTLQVCANLPNAQSESSSPSPLLSSSGEGVIAVNATQTPPRCLQWVQHLWEEHLTLLPRNRHNAHWITWSNSRGSLNSPTLSYPNCKAWWPLHCCHWPTPRWAHGLDNQFARQVTTQWACP